MDAREDEPTLCLWFDLLQVQIADFEKFAKLTRARQKISTCQFVTEIFSHNFRRSLVLRRSFRVSVRVFASVQVP